MSRQQLPPQIRKVELDSGKLRYELVVDTGTTGHRHQIRRRFKTEQEAKDALAKVQGAVRSGTYVQMSKSTVEAVCEDWLNSRRSIKGDTLANYRFWLSPVRQELGHIEIQKLTKSDLDRLVEALRTGQVEGHGKFTSAGSINGMLGRIRAVLKDQMKQGNLVRNVADLVDVLPVEKKPMQTLSAGDVEKILNYPDRNRHLWMLALKGPLRRGEIAGLRWKHVDFDAGTVEIAENRTAYGKEVFTTTPKSLRSRRILRMTDEDMDILRDAKKRIESEYVAVDEFGRPYDPRSLTRLWKKLLQMLGIEYKSIHKTRNTYATQGHQNGVPMANIGARMGHASFAFTMNTYTDADITEAPDIYKSVTESVTTHRDTPTSVTTNEGISAGQGFDSIFHIWRGIGFHLG